MVEPDEKGLDPEIELKAPKKTQKIIFYLVGLAFSFILLLSVMYLISKPLVNQQNQDKRALSDPNILYYARIDSLITAGNDSGWLLSDSIQLKTTSKTLKQNENNHPTDGRDVSRQLIQALYIENEKQKDQLDRLWAKMINFVERSKGISETEEKIKLKNEIAQIALEIEKTSEQLADQELKLEQLKKESISKNNLNRGF